MSEKVQKARLKRFDHVLRREEGRCEEQIMDMRE